MTICLVKKTYYKYKCYEPLYVEILFVQTNGDHTVNLIINGKLDGRSLLHENFIVLA